MTYLVQRGELKKRANAHRILSDITFLAASETEEWASIEVVTLKQHAKDIATSLAWEQLPSSSLNEIEDLVQTLIQKNNYAPKEFVQVLRDKILIGVNDDVVNDDTIDKALLLLIEMDSFEVGQIKTF